MTESNGYVPHKSPKQGRNNLNEQVAQFLSDKPNGYRYVLVDKDELRTMIAKAVTTASNIRDERMLAAIEEQHAKFKRSVWGAVRRAIAAALKEANGSLAAILYEAEQKEETEGAI